MEEVLVIEKNNKNIIKKALKNVLFQVIIILLIITVIGESICSIIKFIRESIEIKEIPEYASTISINDDGTFSTSISAQELWNNMKDQGYDLEKYLDSPEELETLVNATSAMQLPNTISLNDNNNNNEQGKANALFTEDGENLEDSENSLQGIIRFKRHDKDGNEYYLTYASPSQYYSWIEDYNSTGNEYSRQEALSHFTLKENAKSNSATTTNTELHAAENDIIVPGVSEKIIEAAHSTPTAGPGWCEAWAEQVYRNAGFEVDYFESARTSAAANVISTDMTKIPIGATVYGEGSGSAGHVGIYLGNGKIIDNQIGSGSGAVVTTDSIEEWLKWQQKGSPDSWIGWGWEDGDKTRGTTQDTSIRNPSNNSKTEKNSKNKNKNESTNSNKTTTVPNYTGQLDSSNATNDYPEGTYTSSAGLTFKAYKQGYPASWADHVYKRGSGTQTIGAYGCGFTSVAICLSGLGFDTTPVDLADAVEYTTNCPNYLDSIGVKSSFITEHISASQVEQLLAEGKVMAMHYSNGSFFGGSAIYHYVAIVDTDGNGNFMVLNPGGGAAGWYSSSQIEDGNFDRIEIDTGSSARGNASGASNSNSNTPGYQAVVTTYKEIDKAISYDGPNVEEAADSFGVSLDTKPEYTLNTTTVDYESLVQPYTLKFDFLCSLLVIGQSKNFVMDLAKLAYDSNLEVGIYDNLRTTTDIDKWTYKQVTDAKIKGSVSYSGRYGRTYPVNHSHYYSKGNPLEEEDGYITKTIVTRTDSIAYVLSKADTWIVDYEYGYDKSPPEGKSETGGKGLNDQMIQDWTEVDYSNDTCGVIDQKVDQIVKEVNDELKNEYNEALEDYDANSGSSSGGSSALPSEPEYINEKDVDKDITVKTRIKRVEIKDATEDIVVNEKYTAGTKKSIIKDDKTTAPNFVTLFNSYKYRQNRNNILSATEWLIEIMEENENLANTVQIFRYLLYKSTGINYGVTELDPSMFDPDSFKNAQQNDAVGGITNDLIGFIEIMEGAGEKSGEDYVVYYTSIDGCLNVGSGVVVRFRDGSTRFTELIGQPYEGQIVSKAIYQQMFQQEFKEITDVLDTSLATKGVTLTSYQRDAMISFLYNCGPGYADTIVQAYKDGGNEGYWNATKGFVNSDTGFLLGLQRRREQEYKLFTTGVYEWPY